MSLSLFWPCPSLFCSPTRAILPPSDRKTAFGAHWQIHRRKWNDQRTPKQHLFIFCHSPPCSFQTAFPDSICQSSATAPIALPNAGKFRSSIAPFFSTRLPNHSDYTNPAKTLPQHASLSSPTRTANEPTPIPPPPPQASSHLYRTLIRLHPPSQHLTHPASHPTQSTPHPHIPRNPLFPLPLPDLPRCEITSKIQIGKAGKRRRRRDLRCSIHGAVR